jgi:phosphoglycolate phosphatase-like HAD superfamily hydrolase
MALGSPSSLAPSQPHPNHEKSRVSDQSLTHTLVLFDIDKTLLHTGGAGLRAFEAAGKSAFGPAFSAAGVSFAGQLDVLIISHLLRKNNLPDNSEARQALRDSYLRVFPSFLERHRPDGSPLPGAHDLVNRLATTPDVTLGLLTGNFSTTGLMKVTSMGFNASHFTVCAWGDDSPHDPPARHHLPPVAMQRFHTSRGYQLHPSRVVIIGDTEFDMHCGKVNGCRTVGVATGHQSVDELKAAGADIAVPSLASTEELAQWIIQPTLQ